MTFAEMSIHRYEAMSTRAISHLWMLVPLYTFGISFAVTVETLHHQ